MCGGGDGVKAAGEAYGNGTFITSTALSVAGTKGGKVMGMGGGFKFSSSTFSGQMSLAREVTTAGKYIRTAGNALGVGVGLTLMDMQANGVTTSNSIDLTMGGVSFVPMWGLAAGTAYFVENAAVKAYSGKDIGDHIDNWRK